MKHLVAATGISVAIFVSGASAFYVHPDVARSTTSSCSKTFTVHMAARAIHSAYRGTRKVLESDIDHLQGFIRCQRNPMAYRYLDRLWKRMKSTWKARVNPSLSYATVSWYDDAGGTASGFHSYYGFADCGSGGGPCYPFGTKVLFVYGGHRVIAVADDHGPYVSGRSFDLNQNVAQALGFGGVGVVGYAVER